MRVTGRVQGVGFRAFVRRQAERLGVAGTVTNLGDGGVEARLVGRRAALDRLVASLHEGPPGARVEAVAVSEGDPEAADRGGRTDGVRIVG